MTRNLCLAKHEEHFICKHRMDLPHYHYRAARLVLCRSLQEAERKIVPAYGEPRKNRPADLPREGGDRK